MAAWSIAIALALAGGVAYLVWPTTTLWWIAWFAPLPLLWRVVLRERRTGQAQKDGEHFAGHDSGPWWSP